MRHFLFTGLLLALFAALDAGQQTDLTAEPAKALKETQAFFEALSNEDDLSGAQKLQPDVSKDNVADWTAAAKERISLLNRLGGLEEIKRKITGLGEKTKLEARRKQLQAQLQQLRDREPEPAPSQVSSEVVAALEADLQAKNAAVAKLDKQQRELKDLEQRAQKGIESAAKEHAATLEVRTNLTKEDNTALVRYKLATVDAKLKATQFWTEVLPGVPDLIRLRLDVLGVEQRLQGVRVQRAQERYGAAQERLSAQQKREAE